MQSPVLVGRADETSALRAALARAAQGRGGALFLVGEPGIGKSRLGSMAVDDAVRQGFRVLRGRASTAVPLRALCEAVLSAFRKAGAPDERQLGAYLPVLLRLTPDAPAGVPDPAVVRAEAVLRLVTAEKTLVLLEDLHDADSETLAVVDYLLDNLAGEPVLLVATLRPHPDGAQRLADAAAARRVAAVLRLGGLTDAQVAELARHCLGQAVPAEVLAKLTRIADGVPFVVEELLGSDLKAGVPPTVAAATLQRVDALTPACVSVLEAAAIFGQTFPLDVVAAVVGLDVDEVAKLLHDAERAQLVEGHRFRHALTADAIRGRMTNRAALARTAARHAELLRPNELELIAELWTAGEDQARAVETLVRAGKHAAALGRFGSAVELLERGQALAGTDPELAADLLDALAVVLPLAAVVVPADNGARAFALGERLRQALTVAHAQPSRRAAVHLAQARVAAVAGHWERGLDLITAARDTHHSPAVDVVAATLLLGLNQLDRLPEARALAERATTADDPETVCEALEVLTRCTRGHDLTEARHHVRRWLEVAETHGLAAWRLRALLELGITDKYLTAGTDTLHQARRAARDTGAIVLLIAVDLHLAGTYLVRGEYEDAERYGTNAGQAARKLGLPGLEMLAVAVEAGIAALHGRRKATDEALKVLREHRASEEIWSYSAAICSLMEEQPERALTEFDEVEQACKEPRILRGTFYQGPRLLLRVAHGLDGWDAHEKLAGTHLSQVVLHRTYFAWSRAILHGRDGQHAQAVVAAEEALDLSTGLGLPRYLGLRLAGAAALHDGWGDPLVWLRDAEEYFHRLDVPAVAAACRALLREAGAPQQRRRRDHDTVPAELRRYGVTVREYEVLRLVVERFGNAEIAERLFLSPRTVERHVASLRARTGRLSRAELIRYAGKFVN